LNQEDRTTAVGLWMFADSYAEAAKHLADTTDLRHKAPIYFLYAHAIELAFKAFLRTHGASLDDLKCVGHSLPALMERARAQGLDQGTLDENGLKLLGLLDAYSHDHEFRYIKTGFKKLPNLNALHEVASRMLSATRSACVPSRGQSGDGAI
jgi:hypothetical protein